MTAPTLLFVVGPPAVGKMAVGQEIAHFGLSRPAASA
jgi:ATP-dependent Lon protease